MDSGVGWLISWCPQHPQNFGSPSPLCPFGFVNFRLSDHLSNRRSGQSGGVLQRLHKGVLALGCLSLSEVIQEVNNCDASILVIQYLTQRIGRNVWLAERQ